MAFIYFIYYHLSDRDNRPDRERERIRIFREKEERKYLMRKRHWLEVRIDDLFLFMNHTRVQTLVLGIHSRCTVWITHIRCFLCFCKEALETSCYFIFLLISWCWSWMISLSGWEAAPWSRPHGAPVPGAWKVAYRVWEATRAGENPQGARGAEEAAGPVTLWTRSTPCEKALWHGWQVGQTEQGGCWMDVLLRDCAAAELFIFKNVIAVHIYILFYFFE